MEHQQPTLCRTGDIVLIVKSLEVLQKLVDKLDMISHEYGLEISIKKTKLLVASSVKIPVKIICNSAILKQVEQLCYLGSRPIITETSDCHKEIFIRFGIVRSVLTSLNCLQKDRALSMSLKCIGY